MPLLSASDVMLLLINKFAVTSQKEITIEQDKKPTQIKANGHSG